MSSNIAYVNPKILKKVRENYGMSLEIASKNVLKSEKLEKVESGEEHLTFNQLKLLAKKYRLPIKYFYRNEENVEKIDEKFRSVKSQNIDLTPELQEIINEIHTKRDTAIEYITYDENQYDYSFIDLIMIDDDIKKSANKIRKYIEIKKKKETWKNEYNALNSWLEEFTRLGILVFQFPKVSVELIRGFSISKTPYPVIAINKRDSVFGRIFSLLHEFVRLTLKDDEELAFSINFEQTPIEIFCNKVTAEILMPEEEILSSEVIIKHNKGSDYSSEEIKRLHKEFWVSEEAIINRLSSLKLLSRINYKNELDRIKREEKLKLEKKKERGRNEEQRSGQSPVKKVLNENSKTFLNIVLSAYEEKEYTSSKLSRILKMKLKHLDKLFKEIRQN